ncbi:Copia protein, partial [Mucuna pruriens]
MTNPSLAQSGYLGTNWMRVVRNKLDESGKVMCNKARIVAQDFIETFAPIARLEDIRILLSFTTHYNMRLHQMNIKYDFLNDIINEEVFLKQPPGFESDIFPNHVFKLKNALYGHKGKLDTILFCKNYDSHFIIVQNYVDDIVFYATDYLLCREFSELVKKEFGMSIMGELKFLL